MQVDPRFKNEFLARKLSETLGEAGSIELYRRYVAEYPEEFLSKVLNDVMSVPAEKIKKSRGALFTYLLKKHVRRTNNHRD